MTAHLCADDAETMTCREFTLEGRGEKPSAVAVSGRKSLRADFGFSINRLRFHQICASRRGDKLNQGAPNLVIKARALEGGRGHLDLVSQPKWRPVKVLGMLERSPTESSPSKRAS